MWLGSVAEGAIGIACRRVFICNVIGTTSFAVDTRKRDFAERLRPTSERLMHLDGEVPGVFFWVNLGHKLSIALSAGVFRDQRALEPKWRTFCAIEHCKHVHEQACKLIEIICIYIYIFDFFVHASNLVKQMFWNSVFQKDLCSFHQKLHSKRPAKTKIKGKAKIKTPKKDASQITSGDSGIRLSGIVSKFWAFDGKTVECHEDFNGELENKHEVQKYHAISVSLCLAESCGIIKPWIWNKTQPCTADCLQHSGWVEKKRCANWITWHIFDTSWTHLYLSPSALSRTNTAPASPTSPTPSSRARAIVGRDGSALKSTWVSQSRFGFGPKIP